MLSFFAIVAGALLGGVAGEGAFAGLVGAALAWLALNSHRQAAEIGRLRGEFDAASARHGAQAPVSQAPVPPREAQSAPAAPEVLPEAGSQLPAADSTSGSPAPAALAVPAPAPSTIAAPLDTKWGEEPHDTEVGSLWGDVAPSTRRTPDRPAPAPAANPLAPLQRWLFGGNSIVKLGVAILFIGLAFLAKFAAEHVSVPIHVRLAGIAGATIVLLAFGWRLRERRAGYAQVLQGGAVAVLYLTLFVAFRFYGVLAVGPVFGCMVVVAALAAALAVLQDARALAVIGALGGFATPLLVSTGGGNHVALFSYYLVLDLGIAAVAWYRHWRLLNLIGFFATFLVGTAWGVLKYQHEHYASSQLFLIVYFLVFVAILLLPSRRVPRAPAFSDATYGNETAFGPATTLADAGAAQTPARTDAWVNGALLFGLPTIAFVLQHALVRHIEYGTAGSALVLALFYVVLATRMRAHPHLAVTFEASLAIAVVFLTLVIPFALDARSTAGAWALEGAGLVWLGLRQQRVAPRWFGYLLLLLAGAAMVHGARHGIPARFFNAVLFNGLLAAVASLAAAYFVKRSQGNARPPEVPLTPSEGGRRMASAWGRAEVVAGSDTAGPARFEAIAQPLLIAWGTLWLLVTAAAQIGHFAAPRHELTAWLASLSAIASIYTILSMRLDWSRIALPVLGFAPALALGVAISALTQRSPALDGGGWAWPLALGVHAFALARAAGRWPAPAAHATHALGVLVLAALGALQGRAITSAWGDASSAWAWLGWLVVPAALLLALPRPGVAARWPVRAAPTAYQTHAAALITVGLLLWSLLANVASNGAAAPLPHVPLFNPLDVGVGVALLASWWWMRSPAAQPLLAPYPRFALQLSALVGFVWGNAMLIRGFHHYGGVPWRFSAWVDSLAVQTGISLLWSATALVLMWFAAKRALREPWMVGAALLGAVVLKLVLVDLSGTGTVTRIVSFIGVGVLMLLIGYVAPMPAAAGNETARANG